MVRYASNVPLYILLFPAAWKRILTTSVGWKRIVAVHLTNTVVEPDPDSGEAELSLKSGTESSVETPHALFTTDGEHGLDHPAVFELLSRGSSSPFTLDLQPDFRCVDGDRCYFSHRSSGTCRQHLFDHESILADHFRCADVDLVSLLDGHVELLV